MIKIAGAGNFGLIDNIGNTILRSVFYKICAAIAPMEGYIIVDTRFPNIQYPIVMARSGSFGTILAANEYRIDTAFL